MEVLHVVDLLDRAYGEGNAMDDKTLAKELRAIVGDRYVLTDPSELRGLRMRRQHHLQEDPPRGRAARRAPTKWPGSSGCWPRNNIAFIPRGAGTGLSSGVVPRNGEVMIGLSR